MTDYKFNWPLYFMFMISMMFAIFGVIKYNSDLKYSDAIKEVITSCERYGAFFQEEHHETIAHYTITCSVYKEVENDSK